MLQISEAVELFLQYRQLEGLSESTIVEYREQLTLFARYLSNRQVTTTGDITPDDIRAYLLDAQRHNKPTTLCCKRSIIRLWFVWLRKRKLPGPDPDDVPPVAAPKQDEIRRLHVNDDEAARLFSFLRERYANAADLGDGAIEYRDLALFTLLFGAGLRISEAAAAKLSDLALERSELHIPKSKGNAAQDVVLSPIVVNVLHNYLAVRYRLRIRSNWLFPNTRGEQYRAGSLAEYARKLAKKAGVTLTSHTCRRYCITKVAHVNLYAAKELARHQQLPTTLKYVKADLSQLHALIDTNDPLASI